MSLPDSPPILTCAAAKSHEAALLCDEAAEWDAMQRAGRALARALLDDAREIGGLPSDARLLVLSGKGNNAGDALIAAAALLENLPGATADVLFAFGAATLRPLARRAFDALANSFPARVTAREREEICLNTANYYDACIDGVFGFQFRPPLDDATAEIIRWVNDHPRIRLRAAVDLPSGLGDEANPDAVFRADFTYCTGIVKAPVVAPGNVRCVGRARYLDLGFFRSHAPDSDVRTLPSSLLRPLAALRPAQSDKRTYGHLLIVGGSLNYPGAVLMTVQAALRSGVGLLTACVPASLVPEYAAKFPEAMWVGFDDRESGALTPAAVDLILERSRRASALVLGPGLGAKPETLAAAKAICRNTANSLPLLLDADAIRPEVVSVTAGKRVIATPHAGEWQRVAAAWPGDAVLVAKGSPTHVAAGGIRYYSFFGGPVLARGGSGDLLAGLIGGLMAQGPDDLLLAAARGVVWHGFAADLLARDRGQVAVQTTQLLDYLQPALHCADHDYTCP